MKPRAYVLAVVAVGTASLMAALFLLTSTPVSIAAARVTIPNDNARLAAAESTAPTANSGASTAFVIPYPLTQGPDCALPYFTIEPGMLQTSIHVMNTNPVSEANITLALWSMGGVAEPAATATYTIPPLQSYLIGPESISDTLMGQGVLNGSGWITADQTLACLVKSTPSPNSPEYLAAYTPFIVYETLTFPAVGSPRNDLMPQLFIQNCIGHDM